MDTIITCNSEFFCDYMNRTIDWKIAIVFEKKLTREETI